MASAEEPRLAGRDGEIWRLYCRGMSQGKIARRFDISQQRVSQILAEVRDAIPIEERDAIIKRETDLLMTLREEVLELWDADAPDLVSNGRVIEGVKDHAGRLAAVARAESLTARLHRVLGIDAPQKLDLTLPGEIAAAQKAAGDALAHLHGGTDAEPPQ